MARLKPLDSSPIEKFAARVRAMSASRSKDFRMPAEEATELAATMTAVLARLAALESQNSVLGTDIVLDGGATG